jgi:flagellar hook-basal body complex protein FliE
MMNSISGLGAITPWSQYAPAPASAASDGSFSSMLKSALHQVDQLSASADTQVGDLLSGNTSDINGTMIAVEKSDVAFQLMMQVRNKVVSAYQDIEKMQF